MTWATQPVPPANTIWDEELEAAGARVMELPATDNVGCCDNSAKVTSLLEHAGFTSSQTWTVPLEHRWQPEVHLEYSIRSTSRLRLQSLTSGDREACLQRVRDRLSRQGEDQYVFRGEVVMATAVKVKVGAGSI